MTSGDARADAAYVLSLPLVAQRRRELARLALVHGDGHRWNVERAVRENWPEREAALPPLPLETYADPRAAALAVVGGRR